MAKEFKDGADARAAQSVKIEEQLRDVVGVQKTLSATSKDFETLLGVPLPDDTAAVLINNVSGNELQYNPKGEAVAGSAPLADGQSRILHGSKLTLDDYEFLGSGLMGITVMNRVTVETITT